MPEDRLAPEFDGIITDYSDTEHAPEQSEEDKELISAIDDWFPHDQAAKRPHETAWAFHKAYLKGERVARNNDTDEVVRIASDDSDRLRAQMNVLRPNARSLVGKMCRSIPSCSCIPATSDFDEQHGARVATAVLQYGRRVENLDVKYVEAHEYLPWAGNAFYKLGWNRHGGRLLAVCPVCNFFEADEDLVGQECPRCIQQKQMEQEKFQLDLETAKMSALQGVMQDLPVGVEPSLDMIPDEAVLPEPTQLGELPLEEPVPVLAEAREGAPEISVIAPQYVYPEAGAACLEEAQRVSIRIPIPVQTLRQEFPDHADFLHADDGLILDESVEVRFGAFHEGASEAIHDHAMLWEIHEKPTERFPHGRVVFRVNDRIVLKLGLDVMSDIPPQEQDDNPYYVLERFPLYHVGFDRNPGEFWFESPITHAWHLQRELNRIETFIREYLEWAQKPRMLIPTGCRITTDEISAHTAQMIKYNPMGGKPEALQYPPLPQELMQRRDDLRAMISIMFGVTEQDMGQSPTDPNGRAMAIIEAESNQQVGPMTVRNIREFRALNRGYLQLYQAFSNPDVKFSVPGPEGVQTYSFEEMVLKPGWDVQIEEDDGLSNNKAVRLQQAMDLANAGVFLDPMTGMIDKKALMRHAKLNLPQAGYEMEETERAAASAIPYILQAGGQWRPQYEDDAQIFAEELLGWLRGKGRKVDAENPQLVMQIRQIWQFYAMWLMEGQMPGQPTVQGQPGAGAGGPDMSASGGSANNAGHLGTDLQGEAQAQVQQADQSAEYGAKVTAQREG